MTINLQAIEQYFPAAPFMLLYRGGSSYESRESFLAALPGGDHFLFVFCKTKFMIYIFISQVIRYESSRSNPLKRSCCSRELRLCSGCKLQCK